MVSKSRAILSTLLAVFALTTLPASAVQDRSSQASSPCRAFESSETPTPEAVPTLDGRIGGSRESFDARYGPADDSQTFLSYDMDGCSDVFADFFENTILIDVSLFSPRESGESDRMFEDDDADWTVDEAMAIASIFMPPDAVVTEERGDLAPPSGDSLPDNRVVIGTSELLLQNVSQAAYDYVSNEPIYGGFSVTLMRTPNGDVSWIVVQLLIEEALE